MKKNVQLNDAFSGILDLDPIQQVLASSHEKLQQKFKNQSQGFYALPDQVKFVQELKEKLKAIYDQFETLVVLGIGGSALGPKALIEALGGIYQRKVFVVDYLDPFSFHQLLETVEVKKTVFAFISKSGETTETLSQLFVLYPWLKKQIGSAFKKQLIIITDSQKGFLRQFANEQSLLAFEVPQNVGGRFSVLSAVGLLPAYFADISLEDLLAGASNMRQKTSVCDLEKNLAYRLAALFYLYYTMQKRNVLVMMPYAETLFSMAGWFAQLWGESIGKNGLGSTPVAASGPKDQHSQLQLYMEGPQDKVIVFLEVEKFKQDIAIENSDLIPERFRYLTRHSLAQVMNAELQATQEALAAAQRPSLKIVLPELNAFHLGELVFLLEMATAFAGELFRVNAFDQPGVEAGKIITKRILKE